jgi:hypothetical protein
MPPASKPQGVSLAPPVAFDNELLEWTVGSDKAQGATQCTTCAGIIPEYFCRFKRSSKNAHHHFHAMRDCLRPFAKEIATTFVIDPTCALSEQEKRIVGAILFSF